jgi:hypothetical protein
MVKKFILLLILFRMRSQIVKETVKSSSNSVYNSLSSSVAKRIFDLFLFDRPFGSIYY